MAIPALPFSPHVAAPVAAFVLSLVINRAILRWSQGKSLWGGLGRCAVCGARLPWRAWLPGWELSGVRAVPACGHALPRWRALTVIVLTVGGAVLAFLQREAPWPVMAQAVLLLLLLYPLAVIDLVSLVVETRLVLLGLALRFLGLALYEEQHLLAMIGGMLMGAGLFAMVEVIYRTLRGRRGLGEGDAAVMGLIGAFVGWEGVLPVVAAGAVAGLLVGLPALVLTRRSLATPIPFVPFLALAGMAVFLVQTVWPEQWGRLIMSLQPLF
jgi:prepilin signal peptidase PulO-like enzyme (type II secretory pathway)